MDRYASIKMPLTCMIRIEREKNVWYDMRPLEYSVEKSRRIIARLRRKGRNVSVIWLEGMGLGIG